METTQITVKHFNASFHAFQNACSRRALVAGLATFAALGASLAMMAQYCPNKPSKLVGL